MLVIEQQHMIEQFSSDAAHETLGDRVSIGTGLSDAEREAPLKIGAVVGFRYQELSDDGVPRFPSYVGERIDVELPPARPPIGFFGKYAEGEFKPEFMVEFATFFVRGFYHAFASRFVDRFVQNLVGSKRLVEPSGLGDLRNWRLPPWLARQLLAL